MNISSPAPSRKAPQSELYRYFLSFGNGHYAGAVMGYVSALAERRDDPDATLSPVALAARYHAKPSTIRQALNRLVAASQLEKRGRATYRLTHSARDLLASERPQLFMPSVLRVPGMTPRLAAVHHVAANADRQVAAAKWFGVSKRGW